MYVTRPLSMYLNRPSDLSLPPPEGPSSGILVIQDEEAEPTCCFGQCRSGEITKLPFPQNKRLDVVTGSGEDSTRRQVVFIPVLDQPLSSGRYYAVEPRGKHKGGAFINSTEDDREPCCCWSYAPDIKPQPLDPHDLKDQFQIVRKGSYGFSAKSVLADGTPPYFLRYKGWRLHCSTRSFYIQDNARGLDSTIRARLPPIGSSSPVVVGKWYCPFMFITESNIKDQVKTSMFYKMTLEQKWEPIHTSQNDDYTNNIVNVDTVVDTERAVVIGGIVVKSYETNVVDGVMWFKSLNDKREVVVGLSIGIAERMKWEEERVGWVGGQKEVRVKREGKYEGGGRWSKYVCSVLVERFVLRKSDESLVMIYEYKHTHQIKDKWE